MKYEINNRNVIDDITFYIPEGMHLGIIGEIGSGKSTLLKLLLGLYKPTSGSIFIDKYNTSHLTRKELNKLVGYVAQNPILFNRTVYDNMTYGLTEKPDKEYILSIIKDLEFNNIDLDSLAGKDGNKLSGGQKQVVSIIRAFLSNPKIIILDEITSSLDHNTKNKIMKLLDKLFKDKTVIIVTHDADLLKSANYVCTMKDGKIEM